MAELPIATALSLSAVSVTPSVNCLQFSQDGQVIFLTKYAVHILTPDIGISIEPSSVIKQAPDSKTLSSSRPLGWLRTVIEFDRSLEHHWPTECTDWGAVPLGALDPSLQAVTLSPSNITANAGCVLALLNSNLELTIWSASKNLVTGEWIKLQDVTSVLKSAAAKVASSAFLQTLRAQCTCIDWSLQPNWKAAPAVFVDASLLAVGTRAGIITFLRYNKTDRRMTVVEQVEISDRWPIHLAWSAWTLDQDGNCEATLACGLADGSVVVLSVRQALTFPSSGTQSLPEHKVMVMVQMPAETLSGACGKAITGMRWANIVGRTPVLMYHTAGLLHLWSSGPSGPSHQAWSGYRAIQLRTQTRSVGSSSLCPASGISYVPRHDVCVIALSDGSFHTIHRLSENPSLEPSPPERGTSSEALSEASRTIFTRIEAEKVSYKDVDRPSGMLSYDRCSTFIWTYETSRPTDFSYKYDAKHISTLVVAQLLNEDMDEWVIRELAERVGRAHAGGETPLAALRAVFLHLRDPPRITRLHSRILDVLVPGSPEETAPDVVISAFRPMPSAHLSRELQRSLSTHLFGWDYVHSQRLRYSVARFCQNFAEAPEIQQKFADVASLFLANIRKHIQLTLMRHLSAMSGLTALSPHDVAFARYTCHQVAATRSDSSGGNPALGKEAGLLLSLLPLPSAAQPQANFEPHALLGGTRYSGSGHAGDSGDDSLRELCPACHVNISLHDAAEESAICANGHVWGRCCITSFLLATPQVRTCVGCGRKALLAPSAPAPPAPDEGENEGAPATTDGDAEDALPHSDVDGTADGQAHVSEVGGDPGRRAGAGSGGVVRDLLEATRRCPFCGNNFVVLV